MRYRYYTVDVFTDTRFGGNQLAVLPEAAGLSPELMQRIAREFDYAESAFVLPPEDRSTHARVRIFTPGREVPFAGHPNVGTAFVLARLGACGLGHPPAQGEAVLRFEELAGIVPVTVRFAAGRPVYTELTAPAPLTLGEPLPVEPLAAALSLAPADIVSAAHPPVAASVGLPFVCVEVSGLDALARSAVDLARFVALVDGYAADAVLLFTRESGEPEVDLRCRMYAPLHGVGEDAATGSANCALAGLLASRRPERDGELRFRIVQGVEMGRPSRLEATVVKSDGVVAAVRIGGASVPFAEGWLEV